MVNPFIPFANYTSHQSEIVRSTAAILEQARVDFVAGDITKEQFEELSNDVLNVEYLSTLCHDQILHQEAVYAFEDLKTIVTSLIS